MIVAPGAVAERRARIFARYGADVAVITPDPTPALIEGEADGMLTMERRPYVRGDLAGAFLVFCQSGSPEVDAAVASEAQESGCLLRVPDAPERGNFSTPSVIRRGALQIAISTGGVAPGVARRIRAQLKEEFGEEWADYLALHGQVRQLAAERLPDDPAAQQALSDAIEESDIVERLRAGETLDAEAVWNEFAPESVVEADAGA